LEEIHGLCRNTSASPTLRYQSGRRVTFAGNFSTEKRRFFFNHIDDRVAIPCGFFREFPVPEHGELHHLTNHIHTTHGKLEIWRDRAHNLESIRVAGGQLSLVIARHYFAFGCKPNDTQVTSAFAVVVQS
jgi:hypothetical protein